MQFGAQELSRYPKDNATFQEHERHGSLPIIAEKSIIALFRKCVMHDNAVEDIQQVQLVDHRLKL